MRRLLVTALMLTGMLVCATPAFAETVSVGDVVAGPISDFVTVAGFSPIEQGPTGNAPLGTDTAFVGNPVPPNSFAFGANLPFESNIAVGGVGPVQNDVVAQSSFFGGDFTQAGIGNLSADTD